MDQPQPYIFDGIFYSSNKRSRSESPSEKYNKRDISELSTKNIIVKKFKCRENNKLKRVFNNSCITEYIKKIKIN